MANIPEEALLALAVKNKGGGGTNNYNDLSNQPQIGGVTLTGNKSASDLGLADDTTVQGILDGQTINSFGAVETALNGKQASLTAGDYIKFNENEISVNRSIAVNTVRRYVFRGSESTRYIDTYLDDEFIETVSMYFTESTRNFNDEISVGYDGTSKWLITNLKASTTKPQGYVEQRGFYDSSEYTQSFEIELHAGDKLVIKSEMDNALSDKTDTDIVAADFNAGTSYTAGNYCVQDGKLYRFKNNHSGVWSASDVEEVKITGELSSIKSGLNDVNSNLTSCNNYKRRSRRDISSDLTNLATAISEQDLEKYGYSIGDYFVSTGFTGSTGYTYVLADMDTFYGGYNNNAVVSTHHISLVVKTGANSKWAETNDTSGGYKNSTLHTYLSTTVLDNIKADMIHFFGGTTGLEHLVSHKLLWTTATSGAWAWSDNAEYISALSEPQVYGTNVWAIDGYQTGEAWKWLEVFHKFSFNQILGNIWLWLRSICSASNACLAYDRGYAGYSSASYSGGAVGLILFH